MYSPPDAEVVLGRAVKPKRGKGKPLSPAQLGFLAWSYGLGVTDKNQKMTADRAAETMQLVGTAEGEKRFTFVNGIDVYMKATLDGQPTFKLWELLDTWRIKPWFSTQKQGFNKKVQTQLKEAAKEAAKNKAPNLNGEIEIEVDVTDPFDDDDDDD
jgi:hypothetical protein